MPVPSTERWPRVRDVAQRPQSLVGEAEIKSLFLFRADPNPPQRVLRMIRRDAQPPVPVDGFPVGVTAPLRTPGSVAGLQDGLERRYQPAGWNRPGDGGPLMKMFI